MRQQAMRAVGVAAVEVEGIGKGLKGVEREAERKYPIPLHPAVAIEQRRHVARSYQQGKVERDANANQQSAKRWRAETHQSQTDRVIHQRASWQQQGVEDAELCAEDVVGEQNDSQTSAASACGGPIEEEDGGYEQIVCSAANLHLHIVTGGRWRQRMKLRWRTRGA